MKIMNQVQISKSFFIPVTNRYYLISHQFRILVSDPKTLLTLKQLRDDHIVLVNQDQDQVDHLALLCQIKTNLTNADIDVAIANQNPVAIDLVVKNYLEVIELEWESSCYHGRFQIYQLLYNELNDQISFKLMLESWYHYLKLQHLDRHHYPIETKVKTHQGFCDWLSGLLKPDANTPFVQAIINSPTLGHAYQLFYQYLNQINLEIQSRAQDQHQNQSNLIESEIENQVKRNFDQYNREAILREKLKVINKKMEQELADGDPIQAFLDRLNKYSLAPAAIGKIIKTERAKLNAMQNSPEIAINKNYLDLLINLPWKIVCKSDLDIKKVREQLDQDHYGLDKIKERIIEHLAAMQNVLQKQNQDHLITYQDDLLINDHLFNNKINPSTSVTLCLVGPPGVGKTSIARSIAKALDRPFIKIALGGLSDEAELRGHRKTYIGAMSGKIINAIKRAKVSNPVILLDEIDKIQTSFKGNPANALLEILDPEQNQNFQDHYLDVEYDLSQVLFIATANEAQAIDHALSDRLELIQLNAYTIFEKIAIAKQHLIPKICHQHSLDSHQLMIDEQNLHFLIKHYVQEAGVRNLTQELAKIARKIVLELVEGQIDPQTNIIIDPKQMKKYLGIIKYQDQDLDHQATIGCVNGLAYTGYGGALLPIEVAIYPSAQHELKLTGNLKDVMRESAQIAFGYLKANQAQFGIDFDFDHHTIFVHVPAGAIPKDGPSAGITFMSALLSALLKQPVANAIAMTGEITLRGKILPIGGLKEKALAAYEQGIKTVYIPQQNEKHLSEIDQVVKDQLNFVCINTYEQLFKHLFINPKS